MIWRGIILAVSLAFGGATVAEEHIGPYTEGSEAREWGLIGEQKARFTGRVVDILCELGGDCTDDCGGGRRQLAILRDDDGALVLPVKNSQPAFTGAATDLYPFCGKAVEVDGVTVQDTYIEGAPILYMPQSIREIGTQEWTKTNQWTKVWAENHPEAKGKGPWFRRDPRVLGHIAESGYLGLGLEIDTEFRANR